jgi:hypothetical protein
VQKAIFSSMELQIAEVLTSTFRGADQILPLCATWRLEAAHEPGKVPGMTHERWILDELAAFRR